MLGVLGGVAFAVGSSLFAKYLINTSWVLVFGATTLIVALLNASLTYIVIYDVIRDQYFYLSDELTQEFFVGVNYICGLLLFIELSEADTEGWLVGWLVGLVTVSQLSSVLCCDPRARSYGSSFLLFLSPPACEGWFKNYFPSINISFARIRIIVYDSLLNDSLEFFIGGKFAGG